MQEVPFLAPSWSIQVLSLLPFVQLVSTADDNFESNQSLSGKLN
jgi:hypothetical protein